MRRLEDVLRDLAEQDEQLSTDELITRIEQGMSGRVDSSVTTIPGRSDMTAPPLLSDIGPSQSHQTRPEDANAATWRRGLVVAMGTAATVLASLEP
jgi:hypothetical protein